MNSETIVKFILALAGTGITLIALIGGIKEGKESFKKLNEHLDEKDKEAKQNSYNSSGTHQLHS
jgi:hypothetical protein